jgi:hypothetical protein
MKKRKICHAEKTTKGDNAANRQHKGKSDGAVKRFFPCPAPAGVAPQSDPENRPS